MSPNRTATLRFQTFAPADAPALARRLRTLGATDIRTAGRTAPVRKMAWGKEGKAERRDMLLVNDNLTLCSIPAEAHQWTVNGRTPLEWAIERYRLRLDPDSGIQNDPNLWGAEHSDPAYIVSLLKKLVRVTVETVHLLRELSGPATATPADAAPAGDPASPTPAYWWRSGRRGVPVPRPQGGWTHLNVYGQYYRQIERGDKREEYRKADFHSYKARFTGPAGKALRSITFHNKDNPTQTMTWEVVSISREAGFFVIHLGKRID